MHKPLMTALAAALLASGCAMLEPRTAEVTPAVPAQWPGSIAATPAAAGDEHAGGDTGSGILHPGDVDAGIDADWAQTFADPRLQQVIALSLEGNRDLRVAVANVERARAQYRIQRAERLPALAAQAQLERSGGDVPVSDQYTAGLGLAAFELDLFGRVRNLGQAALQQYFAVEENRRAARLALVAEVATAWLTLGADQELLDIAQATVASHEDSLRLAEARHRLGSASALELAQTRTLVESARTDAARYASQVARDRNALELLAGGALDPALLPRDLAPQTAAAPPLPGGLPAQVLLRRPDIMAAEHQLLAANANIGAARAAFFPAIRLTGSLGSASGELSGLFEGGTRAWSFIPTVTVPIFQGGRLRAGLGVAHADRDIALAQYEKAIHSGFRDVADALAEHEALALQLRSQQALAQAAGDAERLSQVRYDAGLDSFVTLLDARRSAYAARQSLVSTRLAGHGNRIALYKALGGGWREQG